MQTGTRFATEPITSTGCRSPVSADGEGAEQELLPQQVDRKVLPQEAADRSSAASHHSSDGLSPVVPLMVLSRTNAWNFHPNLEDMCTGRDVQTTIVCIAECEIRRTDSRARFCCRLRKNEPSELPAFRGRNLYYTFPCESTRAFRRHRLQRKRGY